MSMPPVDAMTAPVFSYSHLPRFTLQRHRVSVRLPAQRVGAIKAFSISEQAMPGNTKAERLSPSIRFAQRPKGRGLHARDCRVFDR
jgi:hypothetical protein